MTLVICTRLCMNISFLLLLQVLINFWLFYIIAKSGKICQNLEIRSVWVNKRNFVGWPLLLFHTYVTLNIFIKNLFIGSVIKGKSFKVDTLKWITENFVSTLLVSPFSFGNMTVSGSLQFFIKVFHCGFFCMMHSMWF